MKQLKMKVSNAKLKVLQHLSLVKMDKKGNIRLAMWGGSTAGETADGWLWVLLYHLFHMTWNMEGELTEGPDWRGSGAMVRHMT